MHLNSFFRRLLIQFNLLNEYLVPKASNKLLFKDNGFRDNGNGNSAKDS